MKAGAHQDSQFLDLVSVIVFGVVLSGEQWPDEADETESLCGFVHSHIRPLERARQEIVFMGVSVA